MGGPLDIAPASGDPREDSRGMRAWSIKDRVAFAVALLVIAVLVVASTIQMQLLEAQPLVMES
jgi:hypothetical protein